jgi:hypothetical protein
MYNTLDTQAQISSLTTLNIEQLNIGRATRESDIKESKATNKNETLNLSKILPYYLISFQAIC